MAVVCTIISETDLKKAMRSKLKKANEESSGRGVELDMGGSPRPKIAKRTQERTVLGKSDLRTKKRPKRTHVVRSLPISTGSYSEHKEMTQGCVNRFHCKIVPVQGTETFYTDPFISQTGAQQCPAQLVRRCLFQMGIVYARIDW